MKEPEFLSLEQVEEIHRDAIEQFGGTLGIRDHATLEAAVFHPYNVYRYGHGGLYDIPAAYDFRIAEAQAFLDGNKRTAVGAALTFLEGNGISTDVESMPLYGAMIAVAEKHMNKAQFAAFLRQLFSS